MWGDSTSEKEVWVEKLNQAIQNLKNNESENYSAAW